MGKKQKNAQISEPQSPYTNDLIFVGVSARYSNKDDTVKNAVNDAARRLSMFYNVAGVNIRQDHIGAEVMNVNIGAGYSLQYDKDLDKYADQLEYDPLKDVFESNNALFVTTRTNMGVSMPIGKGHSSGGSRPQWIDSHPQVEGYITGIGYSSRMSAHSDTVIKSYENAIVGIIESIATMLKTEVDDYLNSYSAFGSNRTTTTKSLSSSSLKNFYIIESWTDPKNMSVWTFAVAKPNE